MKFSGYCFYINTNLWGDFQICISVPLIEEYKSDFSKYANDTTPYNYANTFSEIISDLEITIGNLFHWFCYNNFKVNPSKFYLYPFLT